jgi:hypothetical protein
MPFCSPEKEEAGFTPPPAGYTLVALNQATSPLTRATGGEVYEPAVAVTRNVVVLTVQVAVLAVIVALACANT